MKEAAIVICQIARIAILSLFFMKIFLLKKKTIVFSTSKMNL